MNSSYPLQLEQILRLSTNLAAGNLAGNKRVWLYKPLSSCEKWGGFESSPWHFFQQLTIHYLSDSLTPIRLGSGELATAILRTLLQPRATSPERLYFYCRGPEVCRYGGPTIVPARANQRRLNALK